MCMGQGHAHRRLQEHRGHGQDFTGEVAVPGAADKNGHHWESPLLGTSRSCQLELALNYTERIKLTRLLSSWNPLCSPARLNT